MIDKSIKSAGSIGMALGCLACLGGAARAAEVTYPKGKPQIAMDVPETWAIDTTPVGLEMRAPEKNAIIVADVLEREKAGVDAWAKRALDKMKAFGIAFDDKAKAPPPSPAKPVAAIGSTNAYAENPDAFSFSGPPSLATPGTGGSNDPVDPGVNSLESLTTPDVPVVTTKPKFRVVQYVGTTLNGKPVDVQFAVYPLAGNRLFVVMQESGPEDDRAVKIAKSMRPAK